jgi:hypothetical protein
MLVASFVACPGRSKQPQNVWDLGAGREEFHSVFNPMVYSNEAKGGAALDCFAEAVIEPAASSRTVWLAMTALSQGQ